MIFNEGWGQFETVKLTKYIHKLDPSRFIDSAVAGLIKNVVILEVNIIILMNQK